MKVRSNNLSVPTYSPNKLSAQASQIPISKIKLLNKDLLIKEDNNKKNFKKLKVTDCPKLSN